MKKVLIVGSGLCGLTTALRLKARGFQVEIVEKYHQAGGRLNQLKKDGFTWDLGPTFFSMTYEFDEFFKDINLASAPFHFNKLDTLYGVNFRGSERRFFIHSDLDRLAREFEDIEPNFKEKLDRLLKASGKFFHDTENLVLKRNYDNAIQYLFTLARVPIQHSPKLFRTFWQEISRYFDSREVKEIFSLVSFFLGATPFDTPAIYTLLSYTELVHNGYHNVQGGMYKIVEGLKKELDKAEIPIHFNTEITGFLEKERHALGGMIDQNGKLWVADLYVVNSDAAYFRNKVFQREDFNEKKLDKMQWTLAPFTMYLGLNRKLDSIPLHNYFLGNNFKEYASNVFKNSIQLTQPYYYVNVASKSDPDAAPEGCESVFILCPVPDRRVKPDWSDKNEIAENILTDLAGRINIDIKSSIVSQTILTPVDWEEKFNLYKGSGLGLGHSLGQIGGFRPKNFDEIFGNVFYTGASTVPGTGLPMAIISSKLVVDRIQKKYGPLYKERTAV